MAEQCIAQRLAAILAAAVGYSPLMSADEEGTLTRLSGHRREFLESKHVGRSVKPTCDEILIEFMSSVEAARSAIQTQPGMARRNADEPAIRRIEIRIDIHVGDDLIEDGDIFDDDTVNIDAARKRRLAEWNRHVGRRRTRDKLDVSIVVFPEHDVPHNSACGALKGPP